MRRFVLILIVCATVCVPRVEAKTDEFSLKKTPDARSQDQKWLKTAWKRQLKAGRSTSRYYPEVNTPVSVDGVVFVGTHSGWFYAVDAAKGKVIWRFENDEPISSTPLVAGGQVFFTDLDGFLISLNQQDGTEVWRQYFGREMLGQPLLVGDTLYFSKGEQEVLAVAASDGHVVWNRWIGTFVKKMTMRGHAALVFDGGSLYFGLADGHLYRLSAADGQILWDRNLSVNLRTLKDIDAKVVIDGDSVFVGGYSGAFYRLRKATGEVHWSSGVATGVPALVLDDIVVVSDSDGRVVGLDKNNGRERWFNELNHTILSAPVVFRDKIFVAAFKNVSWLLDPKTGIELQNIGISAGSLNEPAVGDDGIYIMTNGSKLIALKPR